MFIFFTFLLFNSLIESKCISNLKSCTNCIHFIPAENPSYIGNLSKCKKFGKIDLTTRKVEYEYADFCRFNLCKCGINGQYFESKLKEKEPIIMQPSSIEDDTVELLPSDTKLD